MTKGKVQWKCKPCNVRRTTEWRASLPDLKEQLSRYYLNKKEANLPKRKEYREKNKAVIKEKMKEWRAKNIESLLAKSRAKKDEMAQYYLANKERYKENNARWAKTEKGKARMMASRNKRRAQKAKTESRVTGQELIDLISVSKDCAYCQQPLSTKPGHRHVDHVMPLEKGGEDRIENLVVACQTCNLRKHAMLPWEWGKLMNIPWLMDMEPTENPLPLSETAGP